MKYTFFVAFLLFPVVAFAYIPLGVMPESAGDLITLDDPTVPQTYFGELDGFPHTYTFEVGDTEELYVQIQVPDTKRALNVVSGIIVRKLKRGGVVEVARLHSKDGLWESVFEMYGGDRYRVGPEYTGVIEPGSYILEVSTPDNTQPYVLVVGKGERGGRVGYVETLKRVVAIKKFFGKSPLLIIESPFVFIPLILFGILCILYKTRRKNKIQSVENKL